MKRSTAQKISESAPFDQTEDKIACRPFLKWVGGKSQLLPELLKRIPEGISRVYEPFIGGGALLFSCQPRDAYISDVNPELINAYEVVKNDVEALIEDLKKHLYQEEYFYEIRNVDRTPAFKKWSPVMRASRLIYLNKTCYNGLYRVNSKGQFNTPFGRYTDPTIVDAVNLRGCSKVLRDVSIHVASFEKIEESITTDDFVYFDPPYVPLSTTASFTSYHSDGFDSEMQRNLYRLCQRLDEKGVRFMLSNSSAPSIIDLYKKFKVELVTAARAINSKARGRGPVNEVIVTNY